MRSARSYISIAVVALATTMSACVLDELFSPELPPDLTVEITGDTLLAVGDTVSLDVRVLSDGEVVDGVRLSFTSSRPLVAEITPDNRVAVLARDTFSITAEVASGSLAGDPSSGTATFRGIADRVVASVDTVLFSSLTATRQLNAAGVGTHNDPIPNIDIVWHSEVSSVVTVEPTTGLLTAVSNGGPVPVIAQADTRADTVRVVVRQRTGTITITPGDAALRAAGDEVQFSTELLDSLDQSNTASDVSWSSTDAGIVTVDGNGLATAGTEGIANIIAVSDGIADTARVLVSRLMATLDVSSAADTVFAVGETTQVSATGTDTDGNFVAAPFIRWRSLSEGVAVVDTLGVVTATGSGDAPIVGESGGVEDTVVVTVNQIVTSVAISSPTADTTITSLGDSATFVALARDANGFAIPATVFNWTTADTTVAVVDAGGIVVSRSTGTTQVEAEADGFVGSVGLTVDQRLASIDVQPDIVNLVYGESVQLVASGHDARGYTIPGVGFDWDSRDWGIASSDEDGWISPQGDGATYIIATSDVFSDSSLVQVGQLANVCQGGTAHENDIAADETWTLADSPHCVGGWVSVIGGSRLTIEPGVTVKFTSGSILRLGRNDLAESGSLFAEGTPGSPITFTPFNNNGSRGQWQGIQLEWVGVDDSLVLRNVTIEYAGRDHAAALSNRDTFSGVAVLDRVTIRESQGSGINLQNSGTTSSTLIVDGSVIEDSDWSGIVLAEGTASVTNTRISNNGGHGIRGNQSGGSLTLSGNRISGNSYPLRLSSDLLGGVTGQEIDSLLGNTNDTLIVQCCGATSASDTLRTSQSLPWRIDTDLEFVDNTIWKIEAGATIVANSSTHYTFSGGVLRAEGTGAAPITFTSSGHNRGDWGHLAFNSPTDTSLLRNVEFRYGGGHGTEETLLVRGSVAYPVILDSVLVTESNAAGIALRGTTIVTGPIVADSNNWEGMKVEVSNVTLSDSRFVGNSSGGLWASDAATDLTALRSQFSDNGGDGAAFYGDNITVEDSDLSRNQGTGLRVNHSNHDPLSPVVRNNTIESNGDNGLDLGGSMDAIVENNRIINNGNAGAHISNALSISGNRVSGNNTPVHINTNVLGAFAAQEIDSLLGNNSDTLFITGGGSISAADTIRTSPLLPWRIDADDLHFIDNTVWKIEAGATIRTTQGTFFTFDGGALHADGDASTIHFTSENQSPGDWGHLTFNSTTDTSLIRNVEFRYGGSGTHGTDATLKIQNGISHPVILDRVSVISGSSDGIQVYGMVDVAGPIVADSNGGQGMIINVADVTLADSRFVGNGNRGLYSQNDAHNLTVVRSELSGNGNGGADLYGNNNTIEYSRIYGNNGDGANVQGSSPVIRGDTIEANTNTGIDLGSASNPTVENNLIIDNGGTGSFIANGGAVSGNRIRGNQYPLSVTADVLSGLADQDVDSLLGNTNDTLVITCCGNVSTTDTVRTGTGLPWRVENAGNIHFQNGAVWWIAAGTTIHTQGSNFFIDDGVVLAQGTPASPILFTGINESPGDWGSLTFNNGADTSRLEHVEFRYGGGHGRNASLEVWDGEIVLDDVQVAHSSSDGINVATPRYFAVRGPVVADSNGGRGLDLQAPNVTLADSRFIGNGAQGVQTHGSASDLTILRTQVTDNADWGLNLHGSNTTVENSYVFSNTNGGIYSGANGPILRGDTVESNTGNGIDVGDVSNSVIENNLVVDNTSYGMRAGDASTISGNRIRGNWYPLQIASGALGGMGNQEIDSLLGNDNDTLLVQCCGNISSGDTVRTIAALPWRVDNAGHIRFENSSVWKIDPDALIITQNTTYFIDNAVMLALGEAGSPIRFTGENQSNGDWGSLHLNNGPDTTRLQHVEFSYGGGRGDGPTLTISDGDIVLDDIQVMYSADGGISVGQPRYFDVRGPVVSDYNNGRGLDLQASDVTIADSRFVGNQDYGVYAHGSASDLTVLRTRLVDNGNWGIQLDGNNSTVENSYIYSNTNGGIYSHTGSPVIRGDTIESNTGKGLDLGNASNAVVENNLIANNADIGAEIRSSATIAGNRIRGNLRPLRVSVDALGGLASQDIDSLLGNDGDTLYIDSGGSIVASDTVRTRPELPWVVEGTTLDFAGNSVWKIEPASTIILDGSWVNMHGGALIADGGSPGILFTGRDDTPGSWGQVAIGPSNDSSKFHNVTLRNGGGHGASSTLRIEGGLSHAAVLDSVVVAHSLSDGIEINGPTVVARFLATDSSSGTGLRAQWDGLDIPAGRFTENSRWGIEVRTWNFSLDNADVGNNGLGGSSGGIGFWGGNSNVTNSWIHDNAGQGIYVTESGSDHVFSGDTIENNGSYGVQLQDWNVAFTDNIVRNNTLDGVFGDGTHSDYFRAFSGNTVTGNGGYPVILDGSSLGPFAAQDPLTLLDNARDTLCICAGPSDVAFTTGSPTVVSALPWRAQVSLSIGGNQTLAFDPGATIVMDASTQIRVGHHDDSHFGRIMALGTNASPARIIGSQQTAGSWGQLSIENQSDSSVLRHLEIAYGGNGQQQQLFIQDNSDHIVRLDTVTVHSGSSNGVWLDGNQTVRIAGLISRDNASNGVWINGGTFTIDGSRFENNGDAGIWIDGSSGHVIGGTGSVGNILSGNGNWGVFNNTGSSVDATFNWWGATDGPSGSGGGSGDAVSANVLFSNWLIAPPTVP